jgi:riboflavin synthase
MFSGIVSHKAKIINVKKYNDFVSLIINSPAGFNAQLKKGASISVNGVCLTSKDSGKNNLKFDVIEETLKKTNLKNVFKGDIVNLERSIKASTEIGGHLISGHIHFTGKVKKIIKKERTKDIHISMPKRYSDYIMEKGYIGINGCSLTIGKVLKNNFIVHLIPETLNTTNLNNVDVGDSLNVEVDQTTITIVTTIKKILATQKS